MAFQFSNQVSETARRTREEVDKAYNLPSDGQAGGIESTWKTESMNPWKVYSQAEFTLAANITDLTVRTTTDLGKTTRIARPPGNGTEKTHAALWWLCRDSSSDNLRSGFIGGKLGLDRDDVNAALLLSIGREGIGDEDLSEIGDGSLVAPGSGLSGVIGG